MSFLPVKWHDRTHPIRNMSLKSVSNSPVNVIRKGLLFVEQGDLHVHVHFAVVENLAVPLLTRTVFINRFAKGILPMERQIVPITSCQVGIISGFTPLSDLLAVLKSYSDAETKPDDQQDNNARTSPFRVGRASRYRRMQKHLFQSQKAAPDSTTGCSINTGEKYRHVSPSI